MMTMDYSTTARLARLLVDLIRQANRSHELNRPRAEADPLSRTPTYVAEDAAAVYGCVRTIDAITGHPWQMLSEVAHRIVADDGEQRCVACTDLRVYHNVERLITDGPSAWLLNEQAPS